MITARPVISDSMAPGVRGCLFALCSPTTSESYDFPVKRGKTVIVRELTAVFLDHAKASIHPSDDGHSRVIVLDFLDKLYGDDTPVDGFKSSCLKLVRDEMIKSRWFCRGVINSHTRQYCIHFFMGSRTRSRAYYDLLWSDCLCEHHENKGDFALFRSRSILNTL